jgi:hypothetical protein
LIAIENVLVSDDVVEAKFVCDLHKCKGGCCEEGDAGAPLTDEEVTILNENFGVIKEYLTPEGLEAINRQGLTVTDDEFGPVTPTINGGICAYGFRDAQGIIKCGIEAAQRDGKLEWKKPISCHLYPIKVSESKEFTMLNYEPREVLCKPGCVLGKKLKMPVYQFLKDALVRKFGLEFYETLDQVAQDYFEAKDTVKPKRKR